MTNTDDTEHATAHTPEPWELHGVVIFNPASSLRKDAQDFLGGQLAAVGGLGTKDSSEQLANGRRICAAVNACKGIDTEALEQGVIQKLLADLEALLVQIDEDVPTDTTTRHFAAAYDEALTTLHTARTSSEAGVKNSPLPTPFDDYEIHGMKRLPCQGQEEEQAGRIINNCEQVSDAEAEFWSLFGHIPGQGLDCIGDFAPLEHAEEILARITGRSHGLLPGRNR